MKAEQWFDQCKQKATDVKTAEPVPARRAVVQFDFPGVYIFSDKDGKVLYVGESQDIPTRLQRHFGRLRRDGTEMPVESRIPPNRRYLSVLADVVQLSKRTPGSAGSRVLRCFRNQGYYLFKSLCLVHGCPQTLF